MSELLQKREEEAFGEDAWSAYFPADGRKDEQGSAVAEYLVLTQDRGRRVRVFSFSPDLAMVMAAVRVRYPADRLFTVPAKWAPKRGDFQPVFIARVPAGGDPDGVTV